MKFKIILLFYYILKKNEWVKELVSKCIVAFDYFDKSLITVSATGGGIAVASFASIVGAPVSVASASFKFCIFFIYRNHKEIIKNNTK